VVQGFSAKSGHGLSVDSRTSLWRTNRMQWGHYLFLPFAGCIAAAAVCWPFTFGFQQGQAQWWLQILALIPLCRAALNSHTAKQAFARAAAYSGAWLCATIWWLFISMHTYGGLPALLALLAVMALAGAMGLFYAIAGSLFWRFKTLPPGLLAALFAALWTMAEMARGTWLTGFGWGAMAYAQIDGPLAPWIPVVGVYGVGAWAAWAACSLALIAKTGTVQRAALVLVMLAGWLFGSPSFTHSTGTLSVNLLQGNIPQDEKFNSGTGIPQALHWYAEQLQGKQPDLVLAPETAIPLLPQDLPPDYWEDLTGRLSQGQTALLAGMPLGDYERGYTNSVVALAPGISGFWHYDKHHLVPFGEFIPPFFKWFTRMMDIPLGDFNRGTVGQPSFVWKGQRIAPNICYEDLFGEELGARFYDPNLAPTVFANVSNLGWFGDSTAIDQHLQISRMRALEFQRPFLRATNTGTTVILDYQAKVVTALPRMTQGVLTGVVEGRAGTTPYAWWVARTGLWLLWLLALGVLAVAWCSASMRTLNRI
jgi:apolipoprotein N-acyltransferase